MAEQIAWLSRYITLVPGDIVLWARTTWASVPSTTATPWMWRAAASDACASRSSGPKKTENWLPRGAARRLRRQRITDRSAHDPATRADVGLPHRGWLTYAIVQGGRDPQVTATGRAAADVGGKHRGEQGRPPPAMAAAI